LKRAAQLLEQNQLTIAEITYEVDLVICNISVNVLRRFCVTPSEYAQRTAEIRLWANNKLKIEVMIRRKRIP